MRDVKHCTGGEFVDSADRAAFGSISPIDNTAIANVAEGGGAAIDHVDPSPVNLRRIVDDCTSRPLGLVSRRGGGDRESSRWARGVSSWQSMGRNEIKTHE